ncbi:MAG: CDP-alcohol phosphatidyltransferase family protein [Acidimicrobiales bacterium]
MFDGNFRTSFEKGMAPIGKSLQQAGVSPDVITGFGVLMAAACGTAIGLGNFPLAVLLLAMTGLPDALDGAVAKAAGKAGPRGAFLDSTSDRLSDGLLFAGCAWYLAGTGTPRMAMLPFALYIAASLVSYQRAKAEGLGFNAKGGLMERAERFVALGFGLLFEGQGLFVPTLWLMLALTAATAVFRFIKVWRQASGTVVEPRRSARRARRRNARPVADIRQRAKARAEARQRRTSR